MKKLMCVLAAGMTLSVMAGGLTSLGNARLWPDDRGVHVNAHGGGVLTSQTGGEGEIRKRILEDDLVEAIVALPPQLFYSVQIPVSLWFFNRKKPQPGKTVFIDARQMGVMEDRTHKVITAEEVAKIAETVHKFQRGEDVTEKGFAAVATLEEIAAQDYMLTPGRYVGIAEQEEDAEPIKEKLARLEKELLAMFDESHRLEDEIRKQLGNVQGERK